ncbi:hypothetical protein BDV96DRAFT_666119 [Lophiotrema nucula]|uniref:DUF7587 domain-containing protein n=1 Tax=Lophiotrema nucula TaxID=690887 RepID=A0A6A5YWS1_9PLEO|nr:hypothetical protein BDV96DRAFT_666119 [Lophiotrema nucula]
MAALNSQATMETGIEDIAGLVRDLSLAEDEPQDHGQGRLGSKCSHPPSLQEAIQVLIRSTNNVISQAQAVKSLAGDAKTSGNLSITEICSLREGTKRLANIASNLETNIDALNEAMECSVIIRLRSLGSQSTAFVFGRPSIQELFSHFDQQIKDIVRRVLNDTSDRDLLWRVAEECYKQATSPSGILHADDYFIPREEACLEWPYDPDFESEEYYEHENRLGVDEQYAAAFRARTERRFETRRKDRQSWIDFWINVLNNSPSGPTLFYPPASFSARFFNSNAVPQYLFRTFDDASSGRNDESVIASKASITESQESGRTDILTLEKHKATKLLHLHLTKPCFGGRCSDDLMSWTSSLLFAIQYAVWRLRVGERRESEIKICAVDTKKFPLGQFMRDTSLLKAYHATAKELDADDPARKFFDFRLGNEDYYNGEYLSQGAVNHSNRSCVVSLEHLMQAGLFQLYPEFRDASGRNLWAKRVRELRQNWSAEQGTTDHEIQLALAVGRNCFNQFESIDIAAILLTFKNRKFSRLTSTDSLNHFSRQWPEWADKPVEVRRYWSATKAVNSYNNLLRARFSHLLSHPHKTLREIFD